MSNNEEMLTARERALKCAFYALDKKALDVKILEIQKISSIADFLVFASGRSDKQVQAIADSVKTGLKPFDRPLDMEGVDEGRWVVIDFGDIIVHIFQEEVRSTLQPGRAVAARPAGGDSGRVPVGESARVKLKVLWVGKTQEAWVKAGIDEYAGRIRRYNPLEILEARDEKGAAAPAMRERECERLAKLLPRGAKLVLLDERGDSLTSPQLASFLEKSRDQGIGELTFAIGGAYGFTDAFRSQAYRTISLSKMTLTHQMVRIFLLEQIYRGFTIMNGEPYHH